VTARDGLVIDIDKKILNKRIEDFSDVNFSDDEVRKIFFGNKKDGKYLAGDSRGWSMNSARNKIVNNNHSEMIKKIDYRPFDTRFIYYTSDMVDWGREKFMRNFFEGDNVGLVLGRQSTDEYWGNVQVSKNMIDNRYHFSYKGIPSEFPLYLYPAINGQQTTDQSSERTPNLNADIIKQISSKIGLTFTNEKELTKDTFAPIDILDYIYAVLHSPTYREKYKEFLKIDFPRVPYPKDKDTFWQLVKLGSEIRQIHLLESGVVEKPNMKMVRFTSTKHNVLRMFRKLRGTSILEVTNRHKNG
jgi:predicted helicase